MLFVMLVNLYTVRLTLKILGIEDYGIYSAVGGVVAAFSSLSAVLAGASQRFYSLELGKGSINSIHIVFYTIVKVYIITIVVFFLVAGPIGLWFVSDKLNIPPSRLTASCYIYITSFISFLASFAYSPFSAMIIAKEDMNIYAYISILEVILKLLMVFILQWVNFDKLVAYGVLLMVVFVFTSAAYIVITLYKYKELRVKPQTDTKIFKDVFSFSGWTLFGSFANMANLHGINIILNIFWGPIASAAYAIGNQVTYAVNSFGNNFYTAVRPGLIKTYASSERSKMDMIIEFSSKMVFFLLFVFIVPLCLETDFILTLWLGKIDQYMSIFTKLMLIYVLILSLNNPITTVIQASGNVKRYHGIIDSFTLLTIPLTLFAFNNGMSPWMAFIINIVIICLAHIIRIIMLRDTVGYPMLTYTKRVLAPIFFTVLTSLVFCLLIKFVLLPNASSFLLIPIYVSQILIIGSFTLTNKVDRAKIIEITVSKLHHSK